MHISAMSLTGLFCTSSTPSDALIMQITKFSDACFQFNSLSLLISLSLMVAASQSAAVARAFSYGAARNWLTVALCSVPPSYQLCACAVAMQQIIANNASAILLILFIRNLPCFKINYSCPPPLATVLVASALSVVLSTSNLIVSRRLRLHSSRKSSSACSSFILSA